MIDRKYYVYDIETLSNLYSYIGLNIDTGEIKTFVMYNSANNDLKALKTHLNSVKRHIGYNNLSFDSQINQYILDNYDSFESLPTETVVNCIYRYTQKTIENSNKGGWAEYPEWKLSVPELDLFKIKHFDNKAKMTSLKSLEFWMNYPNVQDMPINHKDTVLESQIQEILDYNLNDVQATFEFYKLCSSEIELREQLSYEFRLNLLNANDPKIGEEIFAKLLSEDMKVDKKELKKLRTHRHSIILSDIILSYIKFESKEFNTLLSKIKDTILFETKGGFSESVIYKGFKYDFGSGGIHGCTKSGVYKVEDGYIIEDIDVSSFYPNLAITNGFRPEHLGESFNKIYKYIYDERKKIPKKDPRNAAYKLMLNGVYGKSNSNYSYLYDPKFTMSICYNGQLLIAMLAEQLVNKTDCKVLQVNTDGITIKYKNEFKSIVNDICNDWCKITNLELEYAYYSQMTIMDVNNYQGIYTDNKVKNKGSFEIIKEPHKDSSFSIVPIAISEYFIKGIPVEVTIKNHTNIYEFCGKAKFKGKDYGETRQLIGYTKEKIEIPYYNGETLYKDVPIFEEKREKQQKTTRYYVSNTGATFIKMYAKGSEEFINKGYQVTIFNKYIEKENYSINYDFYINECNKILNVIENKQLLLF